LPSFKTGMSWIEDKILSAFIGDTWFVKKKKEMELPFSSLSQPFISCNDISRLPCSSQTFEEEEAVSDVTAISISLIVYPSRMKPFVRL
jgi:hypothetical protein